MRASVTEMIHFFSAKLEKNFTALNFWWHVITNAIAALHRNRKESLCLQLLRSKIYRSLQTV
jgi:hypothetical protein